MNANANQSVSMQSSVSDGQAGFSAANAQTSARQAQISEDDRYPGSFFRIPGVPAPGKTTWSLAK